MFSNSIIVYYKLLIFLLQLYAVFMGFFKFHIEVTLLGMYRSRKKCTRWKQK